MGRGDTWQGGGAQQPRGASTRPTCCRAHNCRTTPPQPPCTAAGTTAGSMPTLHCPGSSFAKQAGGKPLLATAASRIRAPAQQSGLYPSGGENSPGGKRVVQHSTNLGKQNSPRTQEEAQGQAPRDPPDPSHTLLPPHTPTRALHRPPLLWPHAGSRRATEEAGAAHICWAGASAVTSKPVTAAGVQLSKHVFTRAPHKS